MNTQALTSKYFNYLERQGKTFNIVTGLYCTIFLGFLDYYSDIIIGVDFTLAFFYLLPVSFVTWFAGRNAGVAISLLCVIIKIFIEVYSVEPLGLIIWKNGTSFAFFIVITILLAKIRQLLDLERVLSRTDHLTGAVNARAFLEALTNEIHRQERYGHTFGLAYIDIDNFKEINDNLGHAAGDIVLKTVVKTISENLRRTDTIARLGGDEFGILFPDADQEAGPAAINKIREHLNICMLQHNIPVTFSIGLITCPEPPGSANEIITIVDGLMYDVKKNGKNSVRHAVYARKDHEADCETVTG